MSDEPRVKVFYNKNLGMSPGKLAAQSVHAALELFGVHPGYPVVVLAANKGKVASQESVIVDEGRTEIKPGSTTAGASLDFPVKWSKEDQLRERYIRAHAAYINAKQMFEEAYTEYAGYDEDSDQ